MGLSQPSRLCEGQTAKFLTMERWRMVEPEITRPDKSMSAVLVYVRRTPQESRSVALTHTVA